MRNFEARLVYSGCVPLTEIPFKGELWKGSTIPTFGVWFWVGLKIVADISGYTIHYFGIAYTREEFVIL